MRSISLECAAKVNLYLEVVGDRPDGYHEILTVFQRICLFDTVTLVEAEEGVSLECSEADVPADEGNLAWRAAAELARATGCRRGVHIRLVKRIPAAAGLGGGSSDAAGVLLGLNRLWGLGLSRADLAGIGAKLGADVPFFISGASTALGRGRGDVIEPLPPLGGIWFVLAVPRFGVSAGFAYSRAGLALTAQGLDPRIVVDRIRREGPNELGGLLYNALQRGVVRSFPQIGEVLEGLRRAGLKAVLMSGSGPTVFGIATSWEEACRTEAAIGGLDARVYVAEAA